MILNVDVGRSAVRIEDPRDFRAILVRFVGRAASAAERAALIGGFAADDDGAHIWVRERSLRDWRGLAGEIWWGEGLDGMVVVARKYGFYDEARRLIRAHVETVEGECG